MGSRCQCHRVYNSGSTLWALYVRVMDIRSIIDAEDAPAVRQSSIPNPTFRDSKPLRNDERNLDSSQSQHFSERHDPRPSQPPPLQTPGFRNGRSHQESQQVFVHSPYQQTNPFDAHNGSLPFPQNQSLRSPIGSQPGQYSQRDDRSMSSAPSHYAHGPSTPLTYTPSASTPGSASAYSSWPRPTSSHSIPTPNSAQYPPPGLMRGSPQASHPQLRALPGPHSAQSYASQPNTPLGPPPLHTRPSLNSHRDSPVGYEHQRSLSNGSHGQFHAVAPSPTLVGSPLAYGSRQSHPSIHNISSLHERDRSLSVSPKTRLPDLPEREVFSIPEHARTPSSQTSSAIGKVRGDSLEEMKMHTMIRKPAPERSTSAGINGLLNAAPPDELKRRVTDHSQPSDTHYHQHLDSSSDEMRSVDSFLTRPVREQISNSTFISDSSSAQRSIAHNDESQVSNPQTPTQAASECSNLRVTSSISSNMAMSPATNQTKGPSIGSQMDLISEVDQIKPDNLQKLDPGVDQAIKSEDPASNLPAQPAKKKPRLEELQDRAIASQIIAEERVALQDASNHLPKPPKKRSRHMEIPIWAQSVKGPNRAATGNPLLRSKRPGFEPQNIQANNSGAAPVPIQPPTNPSSQIQTNGNSLPKAQPVLADSGPLGPWEPSILNIIPSEELVKTVSDFLFREIVLKQDIGVGPAGGAAGQGAVLEVEAKIGRLVDKDTNGRIQLPIATECVLSHSTPNLQWKFESTMTEVSSHKSL